MWLNARVGAVVGVCLAAGLGSGCPEPTIIYVVADGVGAEDGAGSDAGVDAGVVVGPPEDGVGFDGITLPEDGAPPRVQPALHTPSPTDGAVVELTGTTVGFSFEMDGTFMAFDIYASDTDPPAMLVANHTESAFSINNVPPDVTIYWRVVGKQANGPSIEGPTWSFSTVAQAGGKPTLPCTDQPSVSVAGVTYPTVQVDDICWMGQDIRTGKLMAGPKLHDDGVIERMCPTGDPSCPTNGGLYTWYEATQSYPPEPLTLSTALCPTGWRLPVYDDFVALVSAHDELGDLFWGSGIRLRTDGWLQPSFDTLSSCTHPDTGQSHLCDHVNAIEDSDAAYWMGELGGDGSKIRAIRLEHQGGGDYTIGTQNWGPSFGASVRCVRDM